MSNFCCPPNPASECLTEEDLLKVASRQAALEMGYREFQRLLEDQEQLNGTYIDTAAEYLKLIQAAAHNADQNSINAAGSALQSLILFNNNYKLLKDAFDNFYAFVKRLGINLTYTLIDIDQDYTLLAKYLKGNPIFRIKQDVTFTMDAVADAAYKGKIIHIRNCTSNMIRVLTDNGVTINPADAAYLRREGSTIGLIYVGNNQWDIYGELP